MFVTPAFAQAPSLFGGDNMLVQLLPFVLIFVIAMAALAMSSIFRASNANLLAKSYDRERDLKFAAEAALAIGKSRVNNDPSILNLRAGQVDTVILDSVAVLDAYKNKLPGIFVSIWVGPTGSVVTGKAVSSPVRVNSRATRLSAASCNCSATWCASACSAASMSSPTPALLR